MALRTMTPPSRTRQAKYSYTEDDLSGALDMVANGEFPGDGPFETAGQARSAANALTVALEEFEKGSTDDVGSRVWEETDNENAEDNGFYFALKQGRRKYHAPREQTAPKAPAGKGGKK